MKKVCIIGHFAFNKQMLDGQTIKTINIYKALVDELGKDNVSCIDTHGGKKILPMLFFRSVVAAFNHKNIIMLPAHNGIKFFAPLLALLSKVTSCKMHYVVIGGWLCTFLREHQWLIDKLKCFAGIYVETSSMKANLEALGFTNVFVMPNFKYLHILQPEELVYQHEEPFKLCTFSRVMKEKGIEDAIQAVKDVNEKLGRTAFQLDIYGQIDSNYKYRFNELIQKIPSYIRYCGTVNPDESTAVLKDYYALLFPTYYEGEGFAGTIVDAFSAGVPVIASDWKYNKEQIQDGYNGLLVQPKEIAELVQVLLKVLENQGVINSLRINCLKTAVINSPENACKCLFHNID